MADNGPLDDRNRPATLGDILAAEERSQKRLQIGLQESEERMQEFMRGLQTELLRGFGRFNEGFGLRVRKIEADHSNLDTATTLRLANFEERLGTLELKVWGDKTK